MLQLRGLSRRFSPAVGQNSNAQAKLDCATRYHESACGSEVGSVSFIAGGVSGREPRSTSLTAGRPAADPCPAPGTAQCIAAVRDIRRRFSRATQRRNLTPNRAARQKWQRPSCLQDGRRGFAGPDRCHSHRRLRGFRQQRFALSGLSPVDGRPGSRSSPYLFQLTICAADKPHFHARPEAPCVRLFVNQGKERNKT